MKTASDLKVCSALYYILIAIINQIKYINCTYPTTYVILYTYTEDGQNAA